MHVAEAAAKSPRIAGLAAASILSSSARFSGAMFLRSLELDVTEDGQSFFEGRTATHKNSNMRNRKGVLLPLVALTSGLSATTWLIVG